MKQEKTGNPDHELENLGDFGKTKFDPNGIAKTEEQRQNWRPSGTTKAATTSLRRSSRAVRNPENESPPS